MSRRKNHKFSGEDLIDALYERAQKDGIDGYELAEILGISHSCLARLHRGQEPIACVSEKILHRMAAFLATNLVHVLFLAGRLNPADFVRDNDMIEQQIQTAFEAMRSHPEWRSLAPKRKEWAALSVNTRLGLALLFERASGEEIVEKSDLIASE